MFLKSVVVAAIFAALPIIVQASSLDPRIVTLEKGEAWTKFRFSPDLHGGAWLEGDVTIANGNVAGVERHELRPLIFEISLHEAAVLQVTDAWLYGDVFDVSWNGQTVSTSSVDTPDLTQELTGDPDYDIGADFDAAFLDSRWSSGSWLLEAGFYQITGMVNPALMEGSAALRVVDVPPVPVPASLALLASGFFAFGAVSMRRRRIQ